MEAFQVANPPILQGKLYDDFLRMVANDILSEATADHVCGGPRDLTRLQIVLFLLDDPLLQKTAVEFILIAAKPSVFAEGVEQPWLYGVFRGQLANEALEFVLRTM